MRYVYVALMLACSVLLSACGQTSQGDLVRDAIQKRGADAYDAGLENSEYFMCDAASARAVRKRYGKSPQLAAAYRTICAENAADPILP